MKLFVVHWSRCEGYNVQHHYCATQQEALMMISELEDGGFPGAEYNQLTIPASPATMANFLNSLMKVK